MKTATMGGKLRILSNITVFHRLLLLVALLVVVLVLEGGDALSLDPKMSRRSALQQSLASVSGASTSAIAIAGGLVSGWKIEPTATAAHAATPLLASKKSSTLSAYQVFPDATPARNPKIKSIAEDKLIRCLSKKSGALWMGEHHNAERDHLLQVDVIRKLHASKRNKGGQELAVGLEQVQVQFQPVLDAYVNGEISTDEMRTGVEWNKRWTWPFEGYRGVFELARDLKIPLIALNVDSEDMSRVEAGGFSNLSPEKRGKYILDPEGFASFAKPGRYKCYVEYVILPSYDLHEKLGLLQYTMTGEKLEQPMNFKKFFSGHILWDEAMASRAYRWTEENPGGLLVGLVGANHVTYRSGIPGRYDRMVGNSRDCVSMILNPSLIDTRPSGSISMAQNTYDPNRLTLQLMYSKEGVDATTDARFKDENIGGSLPLADYILTSKSNS